VRVGGDAPKQFLELAGRPLIEWSFEALLRGGITDIVVVIPETWRAETAALFDTRAAVVTGGATRQESVRLGLEHVTAPRVIVHDAARPFAPPETFEAVMAALEGADASIPGLQMQETVKVVRDGAVVTTLNREEVWNIQTPQAFWTDRLRDLHVRAQADSVEATDDAQLVEHYGGRVVVVDGHPDAFKVTKPGDLERAGAMAERSRR
jgi:2-C-methyl-D-erythritol 4-phosphate cytidylyltransferase